MEANAQCQDPGREYLAHSIHSARLLLWLECIFSPSCLVLLYLFVCSSRFKSPCFCPFGILYKVSNPKRSLFLHLVPNCESKRLVPDTQRCKHRAQHVRSGTPTRPAALVNETNACMRHVPFLQGAGGGQVSNLTDQSKLPEIDSRAGLNSHKIMKTIDVWSVECMDFHEHYLIRRWLFCFPVGKKQGNNNDTANSHTRTRPAVRRAWLWTVGDNQVGETLQGNCKLELRGGDRHKQRNNRPGLTQEGRKDITNGSWSEH